MNNHVTISLSIWAVTLISMTIGFVSGVGATYLLQYLRQEPTRPRPESDK